MSNSRRQTRLTDVVRATVVTCVLAGAAYGLHIMTYSGIWFLEMPFARTPQACAASVSVGNVCHCTIVQHHPVGFPFRANYNDECQMEHRQVAWIIAVNYGLQALFLVSVFVILNELLPSRPRRSVTAR